MSYTPLAPLFYAGELAQNYNEDGELPIQEIAEVVIVKTTKKVGFFDKIAAKLGLKNTKHTFNRHVNKCKHIEKSKYSKPNQIDKLTKKTINKPDKVTKQRNGQIVYEKDFGRKIGTKGETSHKVLVEGDGRKKVTSYPQNKK